MATQKIQYIPEGSSPLLERFVNNIMWDGKKRAARKILKDTFLEIAKKGGSDPERVFTKAIENVKPNLEVRPKRVGGAVYQVPMEVKPNRQLSLAFRWIREAARSGKGKPMAQKLAGVLMESAENMGPACKKREDVHRMAAANKAFAHFAKY